MEPSLFGTVTSMTLYPRINLTTVTMKLSMEKKPGSVSATIIYIWTNLIVDCCWHSLLQTKTSTQQLETNGGRWRMDGNSGHVKNKFRRYYCMARLLAMKTIGEIGFTLGHNALQFEAASHKIIVYSFDIGRLNYTRPITENLRNTFLGRRHLIIGNYL